jgi:drug/metabolite transporter (DMT)-like permease
MTTPSRAAHTRALWMLLLGNLFWGLSFPLIKAIGLEHAQLVPTSGNWFITAYTIAPRFLLAALFLIVLLRGELLRMTALEFRQGLLIGLAAAGGVLFQNDGLQFTSASTSAFLTQLTAILVPGWIAWRTRKSPPPVVWLCCALVLGGVGVLARFDFGTLRMGRGEFETLVCAFFFMGQMLVLDDRRYLGNRALPVSFAMFTTLAVIFTIMALCTAPRPADVLVPWTSGPWLGFTVLLTVFCTLGSFIIMNKYQPAITATEAGLIYCVEPIFASLMALFLPAMFSAWAGLDYANETFTWHLLLGGGLITLGNVLLQLKPPPKA